jgi:hypothetical protein
MKCGKTPKCSRRLCFGSVAVQNKASKISWPNDENSRSPTYNKKMYKHYKYTINEIFIYITSNMLKNMYNLITDWLLIT